MAFPLKQGAGAAAGRRRFDDGRDANDSRANESGATGRRNCGDPSTAVRFANLRSGGRGTTRPYFMSLMADGLYPVAETELKRARERIPLRYIACRSVSPGHGLGHAVVGRNAVAEGIWLRESRSALVSGGVERVAAGIAGWPDEIGVALISRGCARGEKIYDVEHHGEARRDIALDVEREQRLARRAQGVRIGTFGRTEVAHVGVRGRVERQRRVRKHVIVEAWIEELVVG